MCTVMCDEEGKTARQDGRRTDEVIFHSRIAAAKATQLPRAPNGSLFIIFSFFSSFFVFARTQKHQLFPLPLLARFYLMRLLLRPASSTGFYQLRPQMWSNLVWLREKKKLNKKLKRNRHRFEMEGGLVAGQRNASQRRLAA